MKIFCFFVNGSPWFCHTIVYIMNKFLLTTSTLLLVPTVFAYIVNQFDIALSCLVCFATSVANHGWGGVPHARSIDTFALHAIGAFYIAEATYRIIFERRILFFVPVFVACVILLAYWLTTRNGKNDMAHAIVQVVGVTGVCSFVYARVS